MATTPTPANAFHPSAVGTSVKVQTTPPPSVEGINVSTAVASLTSATTRSTENGPPLCALKHKGAPTEIKKAKSGMKKLVRKSSSRPSSTLKTSSSGGPATSKAQRSTSDAVWLTIERFNIHHKKVRKEQDTWRYLMLDKGFLELWPEVLISPFGILDKTGGDPSSTGRMIHDLSFSEDSSFNHYTDQNSIPRPDYKYYDAVASGILQTKRNFPNRETKIMAGDVTFAFCNVMIHSQSVHLLPVALKRRKRL